MYFNLQVSDVTVNSGSGLNTVPRISVASVVSVGNGTIGGGCGPPEMGIRLPVTLLSPVVTQPTSAHGSCTSELLSATPMDTSLSSPLSSVNLAVNGTSYLSFNKLVEPSEGATANISTAVDITFTRAHPKPLTVSTDYSIFLKYIYVAVIVSY